MSVLAQLCGQDANVGSKEVFVIIMQMHYAGSKC